MTPRTLALLIGTLSGLGLINLSSALYTANGQLSRSLGLQVGTHLIGLLLFTGIARMSRLQLRRAARPCWALCVGLLLAVFISGHVAGGARSWLTIGPLRLQPSELLKVCLPLALANDCAKPMHLRSPGDWLRLAFTLALPIGLIVLQPDMGAAGLLLLGATGLIWLSGLPRFFPLFTGIIGLISAPLVWSTLHAYQRRRLLSFLHPENDPSGAGYQLIQSHAAIAHGGFLGQGYRQGTQGRLGFLPEHETDFIFAHLVEEWGLLGGGVVITLLFAVICGALWIGRRQRDRFSALLAWGVGLQFFWQTSVNLGGVLGLMPLTGVTLPFFSYGGSSILSCWMMAGLLAALCRSERTTLHDGPPPIVLNTVGLPPVTSANHSSRCAPPEDAP